METKNPGHRGRDFLFMLSDYNVTFRPRRNSIHPV